jgi:hypothetical protein
MDYALIALLAAAALLALFLYALIAAARLLLRDEGRLRLHPMLQRHGVDPARAAELHPYEAALATRRCVACSEKEQCDAWLASPSRSDIERFCPNAAFARRMVEVG